MSRKYGTVTFRNGDGLRTVQKKFAKAGALIRRGFKVAESTFYLPACDFHVIFEKLREVPAANKKR